MKVNSIYSFLFFLFFFNSIQAQNCDINLLRKINVHRNESLDPTFKFITNTAEPLSVLTPLTIYTVGYLQKESLLKKKAIFVGEVVFANAFITLALKKSFKRDRPYITYPEIENITTEGSYSMPSGHTSMTFATATSLSMAFPKWYVIAPSFAWASAVGYSRMHLGVHYPSDVFVGALVGSGTAFLSYKINKWINKKTKKGLLFDTIE